MDLIEIYIVEEIDTLQSNYMLQIYFLMCRQSILIGH